MENCLKTQLKAVVDNPNLPILETMQQFTLDAIVASGNSSMTDAQKWALNHFFYEIGAINESSIWEKVNLLLMPMLAVPTAGYTSNLVHDYKSKKTAIYSQNYITGINGGLEVVFNSPNNTTTKEIYAQIPFSFVDSDNAAILCVRNMGSQITAKSREMSFLYKYSDNSTFTMGLTAGGNDYATATANSGILLNRRIPSQDATIFLQNIIGEPWSESTVKAAAYGNDGSKYVANTMNWGSGTYTKHTGTTLSKVSIQLSDGQINKLIIVFSSSLTDNEAKKLTDAVVLLNTAFA